MRLAQLDLAVTFGAWPTNLDSRKQFPGHQVRRACDFFHKSEELESEYLLQAFIDWTSCGLTAVSLHCHRMQGGQLVKVAALGCHWLQTLSI